MTAHPFERTIGAGPYRFAGSSDKGGTCSHCSASLKIVNFIKIGDGSLWPVGSSCVEKLSLPVAVVKAVVAANKRARKSAADARKAAREAQVAATVNAALAERAAELAALPHPNAFFASRGKTLADYAAYMVAAGRAQTAADSIQAALSSLV